MSELSYSYSKWFPQPQTQMPPCPQTMLFLSSKCPFPTSYSSTHIPRHHTLTVCIFSSNYRRQPLPFSVSIARSTCSRHSCPFGAWDDVPVLTKATVGKTSKELVFSYVATGKMSGSCQSVCICNEFFAFKSHSHSPKHSNPPLSYLRDLNFAVFASRTSVSTLHKPNKPKYSLSVTPPNLHPPFPPKSKSDFEEKVLFLDSIGLDFFAIVQKCPLLASASLADMKGVVNLMTSMDFTALEFKRIVGMCPEIFTLRVSDIAPVFTFLLREAHVNGTDVKRVINRRPRLLVCSVKDQLRPTLYFLQSIGIEEVSRHTYLLSCSVENKLIPRIDHVEKIGFSRRDAISMFRRFPQLFCYSVKENLEPKFNYFVMEMGRDLKELKEFPQYFSFSLENRIKPRHKFCLEMGVYFTLPILLKTSESQFRKRLEVCCNSSIPLRSSPLWSATCEIDSV